MLVAIVAEQVQVHGKQDNVSGRIRDQELAC
jgi:hypothetical protein